MPLSAEENNALARRFFDTAWNTGEFIEELIAPDAVDHSTVGGHEQQTGPESFRQIVGMFRSAMPDDIHLHLQDEIFAGDKVVHRWRITGTDTGGVLGMPPSGKELSFTGITIVRMADGRIVERWANVDELGLLQQLGLVPPLGGPPQ
jgi:steroid delta-isomerase-like uncharacterized protein